MPRGRMDAKTFGRFIVKRDRKLLDMLAEYDRHQDQRADARVRQVLVQRLVNVLNALTISRT